MLNKRLQELRLKHNLTQDDVASIINVARSTYAANERGEAQMDYDRLVTLVDFYKVSLDYIFGRTDTPIHMESYTPSEVEFMTRSLALHHEINKKY